MLVNTITQPETQLGSQISDLLDSESEYSRIVFVSAFSALRTILRIREQLLAHVESGARLQLTLGIDLGGTSREVLEELLRWNCETFIFHNTLTRATFHPKLYLFQSATKATLFIGSNNLTDGGFYTNYEAATRYDAEFPADDDAWRRIVIPLAPFLNPTGATVLRLNSDLIQTLIARGELPSESEARSKRRKDQRRTNSEATIPLSPFGAATVPLPPLLPRNLRAEEPVETVLPAEPRERVVSRPRRASHIETRPSGVLVWKKTLPSSDALQVREGTAHVGGVRLTQAGFENPQGQRIDQTVYFRRLFADYPWERESGRHRSRDQEHTFVPMRIIIRGTDYGVHNFEISHKPSGEAGQSNYTTILRWGREFNPIIRQENLTGSVLAIYETSEDDSQFLINITDS